MDNLERMEVYSTQLDPQTNDPLYKFKEWSNNLNFSLSKMTYVSLIFLIVGYPLLSIGFTDDPSSVLKNLNEGMLLFLLISTIIMQWLIFLMIYVSAFREKTGLAGLGFKKIRGVDFLWGFSFLLVANLILSGVAWILGQIGLPMPGEISLLIPTDTTGRIVWVAVSLTAGICEETAFRGYLMTRIKILGKFNGWIVPTLISAIVFGACHAYQGWPGFIVITCYGLMFSLLYLRTRSLWPLIIAHFFQDFGALFFPQ